MAMGFQISCHSKAARTTDVPLHQIIAEFADSGLFCAGFDVGKKMCRGATVTDFWSDFSNGSVPSQ
jgi:hypothetical protein